MSSFLRSQDSTDEAPNWDEIARSLAALKIDLPQMAGAGSRLEYADFERIFHQLFLLIDTPGARRRFRLCYPAKDADYRDQFIDSAIAFINQHQLTAQPVSKAYLKTYGGEAFRRLLGILISRAIESEIKEKPNTRHMGELELLDEVNKKEKFVDTFKEKLANQSQWEQQLDEQTSARESLLLEKKAKLGLLVDESASTGPREIIRDAYCQLLIRFKQAQTDIEEASEKLLKMQPELLEQQRQQQQQQHQQPLHCHNNQQQQQQQAQQPHEMDQTLDGRQRRRSAQWNNKRLSAIIKDLCEQLGEGEDQRRASMLDSGRESERMRRKLDEIDREMSSVVESLHLECAKCEERFLDRPDSRAVSKVLNNLIPMVALDPIKLPLVWNANSSDSVTQIDLIEHAKPKLAELESVLKKFPDPNCDLKSIIDHSSRYFE